MIATSQKLHAAVATIRPEGTDFQSAAALEDAVPPPTEDQWVVNPLESMHMEIASQIRGSYRDALAAVDEFTRNAAAILEETAVNVKKSAGEYMAREARAGQDFDRLRGEIDQKPG
ncbi:hypothetical protein GCM10010470_51960 [Saccharopolyspora taberi]|uniref:PE domain-containing protein n=2 Tax=Saccharopolyspora taberi TaxID=60895 RepID=A0ABN3VJG9_9PSEU